LPGHLVVKDQFPNLLGESGRAFRSARHAGAGLKPLPRSLPRSLQNYFDHNEVLLDDGYDLEFFKIKISRVHSGDEAAELLARRGFSHFKSSS
jgi:hypothetical protein